MFKVYYPYLISFSSLSQFLYFEVYILIFDDNLNKKFNETWHTWWVHQSDYLGWFNITATPTLVPSLFFSYSEISSCTPFSFQGFLAACIAISPGISRNRNTQCLLIHTFIPVQLVPGQQRHGSPGNEDVC